jgi:hypothetical protein
MNSQEIQEQIYKWACNHNFTAPYGVLTGSHTNPKGKKYLSVTFGYARTLDATVEIYNRNFMILKRSNCNNEVFKSFEDLQSTLNSISI